jgi:hypothetical protein
VQLREIKFESDIPEIDIIRSYEFEDYTFVLGNNRDIDNEQSFGLRLFILNDSKKILFKSKGQQDSFYFEPHLFQSKKVKDKFIVVSEIGAEYSWGAQAFMIENNKIKYIGHLDVGLIKKQSSQEDLYGIEPSRIIGYFRITTQNDEIKFIFNEGETLAINPGGMEERRVASENVYYIIRGNELIRIDK